MLTLLVFAMVVTFIFLIMTKCLSALTTLISVPIAFASIGGFAADLGLTMLDGVRTPAPAGVMLMSVILYFAIMIGSGLFDPAVRKILQLVKDDPLKVSLGTAALAMIVSLDGDGLTTYMICVVAVLPLYNRLGMSPLVMACLIMLSSGILNITPRGGPTARVANALHVDPADTFVLMIPAMIAGLLTTFVIAWIYGKCERAHLGELHLPTDHEDLTEISVSQYPEARRPRLLWFNAILTVALMATLIAGLLLMPVLFMTASGIAMIVNYPCIQEQKKCIGAHAENILAVISLIFATGVFTGILSDTGMADVMSKSLLAVIPPALGPYLVTITALVSMLFTLFMSNDVFYYGVLPILIQAAAECGIIPVEMAHVSIVGQSAHLFSPLVPPTYLLVGLARTDFGDRQRFILKWTALVCLTILVMTLLLGLFPLSSN